MKRDKVAIITGASRGIGREIAFAFASAGYAVAANYKNDDEKALNLKAEIEKIGSRCEIFKCDVSIHRAVEEMAASAAKTFGQIDVVVNNAAICRDRTLPKMSEAEWDEVIVAGLSGPFYVMKEFVKYMMAGESAIINIASIAGVRGNFGGGNYAAAKAGLIALTKTAAKEFGENGITVNAVLPGFHFTDMGKTMPEVNIEKIKQESVLKTTTNIKELAAFVVFIAGLRSVSGQVFNVDSRII